MTRYIKRHSLQARLTHDIFVISCILLAITGLFVFVAPLTALVPAEAVFVMRMAHRVLGVIFTVVPLISAIIAPRGVLHMLKNYTAKWDKDDVTFIKRFVPYMLGPKRVHMPDQHEVKSGQRIADGMLIVLSLLMIVSGLMLMLGGSSIKMVALFLHDLGFLGLAVFGLAHIYLGLGVFQPYRRTARLMFGDGTVSESDALYHWGHWAREELESGKNIIEKE
ncbi:MAG: cytochrome b/b6 domain-containing protein [Coriobacteriales bacterium]|jgi:formate dehydrogenase subunit gamma|nr:cytochrome b/b6 domain-containing protein [Coriobacteriales bacterium]